MAFFGLMVEQLLPRVGYRRKQGGSGVVSWQFFRHNKSGRTINDLGGNNESFHLCLVGTNQAVTETKDARPLQTYHPRGPR